ncbi:hypothetical protein AX14_009333, partial [Amanita brunnescens Koide BX004]
MHDHFSSAHSTRTVSDDFINSIPQEQPRDWPPISQQEILDMIKLTSNSSAPGPDHVTWHHLKAIAQMEDVLAAIQTLFNNVVNHRGRNL